MQNKSRRLGKEQQRVLRLLKKNTFMFRKDLELRERINPQVVFSLMLRIPEIRSRKLTIYERLKQVDIPKGSPEYDKSKPEYLNFKWIIDKEGITANVRIYYLESKERQVLRYCKEQIETGIMRYKRQIEIIRTQLRELQRDKKGIEKRLSSKKTPKLKR